MSDALKKCKKKKHQPLKVSVSNIVVLLKNQLLCSNYLISITVIMQFYSKTSIESEIAADPNYGEFTKTVRRRE